MNDAKQRKNLKRKSAKIILFIVFLIIIAIGTSSGVFLYFKSKDSDYSKKNTAIYYAVFDDGTYYIPKAEPDIKFEIDSDDSNSYKLTNSNGENVQTNIVKIDEKKYIQATKNYIEGETYQLQLDTASFTEEALK